MVRAPAGGRTLLLALESTEAAFDCDPPSGRVGRGPARPYHLAYHVFDALAAPAIGTLDDGRLFADYTRMAGRLARSFEPRERASRWVVTLREGVRSHAGNELTAEDVVWSYERVMALRAIGMWRASTIAGIAREDGVRALGRHRVEFRLEGHNPDFPRFLSYATAAVVDAAEARRHQSEDDPWATAYLADSPCGFGAFALARRDEERLELAPRPEFWAGAPPVDGVAYVAAPTRERGLELFESGAVNVLAGLYPDEARRVERPGVRLLLGRTNHATIELDRSRAPFRERAVREAVLRAVPYKRVVEEGYLGFAERQRGIYQPNTPGYDESGWVYDTDPDGARRLVERAGASGSAVTFCVPGSAEGARIGALVAEALGDAGLSVRVVTTAELAEGEIPEMYLRGDCSHGIADRHYDLGIDFAAPRGMPGRLFESVRLSARMRAIRQAPPAEQPELYRRLQLELLADAAVVPLAGHSYVIALREGLHPWFLSPAYLPLSSLLWSAARYVLPAIR
ncbi:MAG: ABC transporter substrate-binding protein [Chloroflexi bacterium]|nr:ABC transporter substrate-binding protein [Chloroflexota bacterium]